MCNLLKLTTPAKKSDRVSFTKTIRLTEGELSQAVDRPAWGIDPGRNFGLTIIEGTRVLIYHGVLSENKTPGMYGWLAHGLLEHFISQFDHKNARLIIEGASYGDPYGQVLLAEIRGGFFLAGVGAEPHFESVTIKPPKSIRKGVFCDGTIRGPEEWPTLNKNAADSLVMALYAAELSCCV